MAKTKPHRQPAKFGKTPAAKADIIETPIIEPGIENKDSIPRYINKILNKHMPDINITIMFTINVDCLQPKQLRLLKFGEVRKSIDYIKVTTNISITSSMPASYIPPQRTSVPIIPEIKDNVELELQPLPEQRRVHIVFKINIDDTLSRQDKKLYGRVKASTIFEIRENEFQEGIVVAYKYKQRQLASRIQPVRAPVVIDESKKKICAACKIEQFLHQFRKSARSVDKHDTVCSKCRNVMYKNRIESDPIYKTHLAGQRAVKHIETQPKISYQHKVRFQVDKPRVYARRAKYKQDNPESYFDEVLRKGAKRLCSCDRPETRRLRGCSAAFFCKWLDFHFTFNKSFTRKNHGKVWHLDHVIPVAVLDKSNPIHVAIGCNWRNYMPLTVADNLSKNKKIDMFQIVEQNRRLKLFSEITGETYEEVPLHIIQEAKYNNCGESVKH